MKSLFNFLVSKGQTGALLLALVVIAIFLGSVFAGFGSSGYDMSTDLNKLDAEAKQAIDFFNPGLILSIVLAVIAAGAALIFGVAGIFKFPKSSKRGLIGIALLAVVFFAFYSMSTSDFASGTKMAELIQKNDLSEGVVKFISGGLNVGIIMALASVLLMVVFGIKNAFN